MVVRVVGFDPRCDPAQPSTRAPGAPHLPSSPRRRSSPPLPFPVRRGPSSPLSGGARPAPAPRPPGVARRGHGPGASVSRRERGPCAGVARRGLGARPRPPVTRRRPLRAASTPPAHGRSSPVARRPTLGLVSFKISLMSVLRRALRRATIQFKFVFINVLRRATILLVYIH
jgi:hypothetical protein